MARAVSLLIAAPAVCISAAGQANVRLPGIFGSHMVLQRDVPIRLWGWADPGEPVMVDFHAAVARTVADPAGRWSVTMPSVHAGGPYRLLVTGRNRLVLDDVLVGDVWLASGQSNMEFSLAGSDHASADLKAADDDHLRLVTVDHYSELGPAPDLKSKGWALATPAAAADFSAVAFLFGRAVEKRYRIPVGIIQSTWGGTYIESWMSAPMLEPFPAAGEALAKLRSITPADRRAVAAYLSRYDLFMAQHRTEDQGTVAGRPVWARPGLDLAGWEEMQLPRPDSAWGTDFNRFDGFVWFRRDIDIPASAAGTPVSLTLGVPFAAQEVFWNGVPIGKTAGAVLGRYEVPAVLVKQGTATLAFRLKGAGGYIIVSGAPEQMVATAGTWRLKLSGTWHARPGTDLAGLPQPPAAAAFVTSPGPTMLWNGMVAPLTPMPIKGVLWYQGESNVGAADAYRGMFPAMIKGWRAAWSRQFPFLFVQIAGYAGYSSGGPELRDAQATALALRGVGMATAADLGEADNVHPRNKRQVASRLVLAARHLAYGEQVEFSGPVLRSVTRKGDRLILRFGHLGGGLVNRKGGRALGGFEIAGPRGDFVSASALIEGPAVVVHSTAVRAPSRIRYDWSPVPLGELGNRAGLPAAPFNAAARPPTSKARAAPDGR